jgi:hypothetical protein
MSSYNEEVTKDEIKAIYRNGYGSISQDEARKLAKSNGYGDIQFDENTGKIIYGDDN